MSIEIERNLQEFISLQFANGRPIERDTQLLGEVVDSLGLFVLVQHIETAFGVRLSDSDLTVDNLESVGSIATLLSSRTTR